jgi:hypothetical protein
MGGDGNEGRAHPARAGAGRATIVVVTGHFFDQAVRRHEAEVADAYEWGRSLVIGLARRRRSRRARPDSPTASPPS